MSLTNYERKFDQLMRYTTYLVNTKPKKIKRFEQELDPDISMILTSYCFATYCENIGMGLCYLLSEDWFIAVCSENGYRSPGQMSKDGDSYIPSYPKCGKSHKGECFMEKNIYFRCGKPGHIAKNCTEFSQKKNNDQDNVTKIRLMFLL
ncbi:Pepsin-retropepsin like protein [Abeliophyllum distichum]|uniref:Pepsin-retropepsin like protein n=1 Tax=Abeliophyllum distichum TaxID=126358 RepID=A0ABD1TJB9_9LAMI